MEMNMDEKVMLCSIIHLLEKLAEVSTTQVIILIHLRMIVNLMGMVGARCNNMYFVAVSGFVFTMNCVIALVNIFPVDKHSLSINMRTYLLVVAYCQDCLPIRTLFSFRKFVV
jgi:hypothetical protein